jgi:hypothetical protein
MEIETRSRLAAALKTGGTRAGGKARTETAFEADADSVTEPPFFCLKLGAAGLGGDLLGRWRSVAPGGFGRLVLLWKLRRGGGGALFLA